VLKLDPAVDGSFDISLLARITLNRTISHIKRTIINAKRIAILVSWIGDGQGRPPHNLPADLGFHALERKQEAAKTQMDIFSLFSYLSITNKYINKDTSPTDHKIIRTIF
jgi:hypothetical protein